MSKLYRTDKTFIISDVICKYVDEMMVTYDESGIGSSVVDVKEWKSAVFLLDLDETIEEKDEGWESKDIFRIGPLLFKYDDEHYEFICEYKDKRYAISLITRLRQWLNKFPGPYETIRITNLIQLKNPFIELDYVYHDGSYMLTDPAQMDVKVPINMLRQFRNFVRNENIRFGVESVRNFDICIQDFLETNDGVLNLREVYLDNHTSKLLEIIKTHKVSELKFGWNGSISSDSLLYIIEILNYLPKTQIKTLYFEYFLTVSQYNEVFRLFQILDKTKIEELRVRNIHPATFTNCLSDLRFTLNKSNVKRLVLSHTSFETNLDKLFESLDESIHPYNKNKIETIVLHQIKCWHPSSFHSMLTLVKNNPRITIEIDKIHIEPILAINKRNLAIQRKIKKCMLTLMAIRKYESFNANWYYIPKEIIAEIAKYLYSTRNEQIWI